MKEINYTHVIHPFPALYDADSKILILGSLPSVKSREQNFFYGTSAEQVLEDAGSGPGREDS